MGTLRVWATSPLVPLVGVTTVALTALAVLVAATGMLAWTLATLLCATFLGQTFIIPLRPAAAPRARRTHPRHAKRRGYGASAPYARRDGRAHKRPAASTEDTPPRRETPPALDRTQRLPVYRAGRAPVGGAHA